MQLNRLAFTISCAVVLAVILFGGAWWIMWFDGPVEEPSFLTRYYRGYAITPIGSLYGLGWGLLDGAILGFIFSTVYNFVVRRTGKPVAG